MAHVPGEYRFTPARRRALAIARKKSAAARSSRRLAAAAAEKEAARKAAALHRAKMIAIQKEADRKARRKKIIRRTVVGVAVAGVGVGVVAYTGHKVATYGMGTKIHKVPGPTPPNAALRRARLRPDRYREIFNRSKGGAFAVGKAGQARYIRRPRQKYNSLRRKGR